jgi:hypothetical protein
VKRGKWSRVTHRRLGRRGECLMFFGVLDLVYAWSMFFATPTVLMGNSTYRWVGSIAPLQAWAMLWALVGLICIYHAFQQFDRFGFIAAIGIKVVWGVLSLGGWLVDDVSLGAVGIWLGLAGLVWRISGWRECEDEV